METKKICPNCRKPLPPDVPLGLCPECLIKSGFPTGTGPGAAAEGPGSRFVPPPVEEIARLFPQLEILGLIGRGGMGAVYKARQPALDRLVALKVLPPAVAGDPGFAERFNREARALARLNHPNIVAVHDFGQAGPLHYLLMEFVDGTNLRDVERSGKLSPEQALAIVPQICEALQFAHNEGVVHRDIKPENLLLDKRGRLKITDFGIAKIVGAPAGKVSLTGARDVVGTPHYMAPEQIEQPQRVDHRADIYSLGVVFYEMLTGELPLGKFQPPSKKVQIDVRLDEVVLHTLEKEPERRYQQAGEVKTAVETIAAVGAGVVSRRDQSPVAVRRQVIGPAIGLLVTGILNWLLIPTAIWLFVWGFPHTGIYSWMAVPGSALVCVALLSLGLCSFIIFAAFKMMQLERRGAAMLASVLTIFVSPGNLIGLPIGIWSLVVLNRREVREAFAANQPARNAPAAGGLGWKIVGVATALIGLILAFFALTANHSRAIRSDYIGQIWFPRGDSIQITAVDRSMNQLVVKGHYSLVSHDQALLALYITTTNTGAVATDPLQQTQISRGSGNFELIHRHLAPGLPHVSMYADGRPFAAVYFGTKAEALEESKATWITNIFPAGLIGWWNADDTAVDSVTGDHGVLVNGVTFAPGIRGRAFRFNGDGAFVKIPQTLALNPGNQVTIEFWMKADPDNAMQNYQGLMTSDFYSVEISNGRGGRLGVNLGLSTTADPPVPASGVTTVANFTEIANVNGGGAPVTAGEWHLVAATYDGAKLQLYIDGQSWGQPVFHTGAIRPMLPGSFVSIGSEDGRTTCPDCIGHRYFKGLIDEVKIYSRALSAAEIKAAYAELSAAVPRFGPVKTAVLKSDQQGAAELLDLDTERFATSTNFGANDRETHAWIRANGLDAVGVVEKGMIAVLCCDMAVVPAHSNSWDAVTAQNIVTNWGLGQQEPNKITPVSPVTDHTDTWWFRTREGGQGVLQILGPNADPPGVKIRYQLVQNPPATTGQIVPAIMDQIQAAFAELKGLNDMTSGRQYELSVGGRKVMGEGDDFLRRRTAAEILDSGLSSGCGDYAVAFIALMEKRGLQTLLVDSAEVSLYSLEYHFSGHAVVAVRDLANKRWLLADPTNRRILTNNWATSDKTFYDGRYWIGYCGPLDQYPVHTPEELKAFYAETLKPVPPDVWNQRIFKLNFNVDVSLIGTDGSYLNPNIPQLTASQDAALVKFGIHPKKEAQILLTKGGDDARSTLEYSDQAGWVCTLGLRSSCNLGLVNYLQLQVASEAVHNPQAVSNRQTETNQSVAAARVWLALMDEHQYAESWESGSDYFRGAVTQDKWVSGLVSFRDPLGKAVSRSLKSAESATSLPGAPDGQYVVMQFNTSFANKKSAVETVTFMLGKDGHWRAAGYFIK